MTAVAQPRAGVDQTELPYVVRCALKLGLIEVGFALAIGLTTRFLEGPAETALLAVLVTAGVLVVTLLPGIWTGARTIEGIAGAAGIGLAATVVFLLIDVTFLQGNIFPFRLWTNRWLEIGGGSNWWYHPVWWMVGTYLPWLGAWNLANGASRSETASPVGVALIALGLTVVCAVTANLVGFPGAGWNVGTFGVAFLPGLALATVVSVLGARRK